MAFSRIAALWDRFLLWAGLRHRTPPPPLRSFEEIDHNGFYLWEARHYRAVPTAFWFNPDRYKDQPGQYPDPDLQTLRSAWDEALSEARAAYGDVAIDKLILKMAKDTGDYSHPDPANPVPFLMERYEVKASKGRYQRPG